MQPVACQFDMPVVYAAIAGVDTCDICNHWALLIKGSIDVNYREAHDKYLRLQKVESVQDGNSNR